jgi:hypothetical protein
MAQEALIGIDHTSDKKHSAQLRCKAELSLRMALIAIDEDRPLGRRRRPSNLPRISQSAPE